jgi:hypothetical protein
MHRGILMFLTIIRSKQIEILADLGDRISKLKSGFMICQKKAGHICSKKEQPRIR